MNICPKNKVNDNGDRILILEATIDGSDYLLINFYNANTEKEQLITIKNLNNLLKDFEDFHDEKVIFAGDFIQFFYKNLESAVEGDGGWGGGRVLFSKNIVYPGSLN